MKKHLNDLKKKSSLNQIHFTDEKKQETLQRLKELGQDLPNTTFMFKKTLSFATLAGLLIIIATIGYQSMEPQTGADQIQQKEDKEEQKKEQNKLTKQEAKTMLTQFYYDVTPDLDKYNIEKRYSSKKEAIKAVSRTTSQEVATTMVDRFFKEKDGKLKPKTFHGIKKLNSEEMTLEKESNTQYIVEQLQSNELSGTYVIQAEFERVKDNWIITKYEIEYKEAG
jgi:hypothetical protein